MASRSKTCAAAWRIGGLLADLAVDLPHPVADLGALAGRDVTSGLLLEVGDVGRAQAAPRHVDLTGLRGQLERRRLGEVLDEHGRRERLVLAGVLLVGLERRLDAGLVLAQLVGPGADDVLVGLLHVGREGVLVDDRRRTRVGEDVLERRVRLVEVEDHRGVVRRLDRVLVEGDRAVVGGVADAAEQVDRGTVGVLDRDRALEAVLHVGGREVVAVGELQALVEGAGERLGVVVGALRRRVADDLVDFAGTVTRVW